MFFFSLVLVHIVIETEAANNYLMQFSLHLEFESHYFETGLVMGFSVKECEFEFVIFIVRIMKLFTKDDLKHTTLQYTGLNKNREIFISHLIVSILMMCAYRKKIWPLNSVHVVRLHINAAVCGELIKKKNTVLLFELVDSGNGSLDCAA